MTWRWRCFSDELSNHYTSNSTSAPIQVLSPSAVFSILKWLGKQNWKKFLQSFIFLGNQNRFKTTLRFENFHEILKASVVMALPLLKFLARWRLSHVSAEHLQNNNILFHLSKMRRWQKRWEFSSFPPKKVILWRDTPMFLS